MSNDEIKYSPLTRIVEEIKSLPPEQRASFAERAYYLKKERIKELDEDIEFLKNKKTTNPEELKTIPEDIHEDQEYKIASEEAMEKMLEYFTPTDHGSMRI